MPVAISIKNETLSKDDLEELARKCQVTRIGKRLKATVLIPEGKLSRFRVERKLKVGVQTLCDRGKRYNVAGLSGLNDRPRTGRPSKLTDTQQQAVVGWIIEGTLDDEPNWTLRSLQLKIKKVFGVSFGLESVSRLVIRDGLRYHLHRNLITIRLCSRHSSSSAIPFARRQGRFFQKVLPRNGYGCLLRMSRGLDSVRY